MIRETVLAAVVAGLIAALVFTVVQSVWVTPLILQGEAYEDAAEAASHSHVHEGHIAAPQDGAGGDSGSRTWVPGEIWRFFTQF